MRLKFLHCFSNNLETRGIATSEVIEDMLTHENTRCSLGTVLNHVLMHQTEGLITPPETAHNLKCVVDKTLKCKKPSKKKEIAMNYSGQGLVDLTAYEQLLASKLVDYKLGKIEVPTFSH